MNLIINSQSSKLSNLKYDAIRLALGPELKCIECTYWKINDL